jgi:iron complex transport system permease protein
MRHFFILLALLILLLITNLLVGSVRISPWEIIKILSGFSSQETWEHIIWMFRLPKALTAILVGASLSVAGLLMQTFFANPLASPSELGVSAGASLGVAAITLSSGISWAGLQNLGMEGHLLVIGMAILGATGVLMVVLSISLRVQSNVILLIVGLMLSSFVVSVIGLWQFMSSPEQIRDFLWWTFGSLGGTNYTQILLMAIVCIIVFLYIFVKAHTLNVFLLGEKYAQSLGINIKKFRFQLILVVGMLVGSITAFCGPIGFIGIAVPHITRNIFKTSNHQILIPATALVGSIVLLACDILSNVIYPNFSLPINTITTFIGSLVVIWMLVKKVR